MLYCSCCITHIVIVAIVYVLSNINATTTKNLEKHTEKEIHINNQAGQIEMLSPIISERFA